MATDPVRRAVDRPTAGRLEVILAGRGYRLVAGVDEVGRGALAGPLVAAAVMFEVDAIPDGLCDSKLLEPDERREAAERVHAAARSVSFAVASHDDIDNEGIQPSNIRALERAAAQLRPLPDYLISDWFRLDSTGLAHVALPKADELSACVAAASIVAKVARDAHMTELDADYPGYGFARHKGYRSPEHWAAIRALGPSPVHRRSFKGVTSWQASFDEVG